MIVQRGCVITLSEEEIREAVLLWIHKHKLTEFTAGMAFTASIDGDRTFDLQGAEIEVVIERGKA